jgi:endonuclease-3
MEIEKILKLMEREARKRHAPVFSFEEESNETPFKILIATMLSARTKDTVTIKAIKRLFKIAPTPAKIAKLKTSTLEKILYGVGFYRTKAKNLKKTALMLIDKFNGKVPNTLENLLLLPGVGRKTANIVLARAFGKYALGVDVHVHRISNRLGLVKTKKPEETEKELMRKIPKRYIKKLNKIFVAYGQTICLPVKPNCFICKLNNICQRVGVR